MVTDTQFLLPEIRSIIQSKNYSALKELFEEIQAPDIADVVMQLQDEEQAILFRLLPKQSAREVFEYLSPLQQEKLLVAMSTETVADLVTEMAPDDRTALLEELPEEVTTKLISHLPAEELNIIRKLLAYPEQSVGRIMTPDYMALPPELTVSVALERIRKEGIDKETINVIYLIDEHFHLVGTVSLRDIVLASPEKKLSELRRGEPISISAIADQEEAVALIRKYDRIALPVVDSETKLIGIVTVDDLLDIAQEEATEDIQKMGAMEALDEPYFQTRFWPMVKKRGPILLLLFVEELFTGTALRYYSSELEHALALMFFVPLIVSSGGNSGSQSATLVVRGMAIGEIRMKDWLRVFSREIGISTALGVFLGICGFIRAMMWGNGVLIASTVACTIFGIIIVGTLVGAVLPFVIRKIGFDPAVSSSPFLASLVDVIGIVIYFSVAKVILHL